MAMGCALFTAYALRINWGRAMRSSGFVVVAAAIIILATAVGKPSSAEQAKEDPYGTAAQPRRSTEERPFGGPPPMQRGTPTGNGAKCKTAKGVCSIDPAKPLGTPCSCPGSTGTSAEGKVVR
jgi:hypothetical protein